MEKRNFWINPHGESGIEWGTIYIPNSGIYFTLFANQDGETFARKVFGNYEAASFYLQESGFTPYMRRQELHHIIQPPEKLYGEHISLRKPDRLKNKIFKFFTK